MSENLQWLSCRTEKTNNPTDYRPKDVCVIVNPMKEGKYYHLITAWG